MKFVNEQYPLEIYKMEAVQSRKNHKWCNLLTKGHVNDKIKARFYLQLYLKNSLMKGLEIITTI